MLFCLASWEKTHNPNPKRITKKESLQKSHRIPTFSVKRGSILSAESAEPLNESQVLRNHHFTSTYEAKLTLPSPEPGLPRHTSSPAFSRSPRFGKGCQINRWSPWMVGFPKRKKTEFRELTSCQPRKIKVTFSKSYLAHVFPTQHETTQGTSCVACFFGILWIVNPLRLQLLFSGINLIFLQAMGIEVGENSWNLSLEGVPIG